MGFSVDAQGLSSVKGRKMRGISVVLAKCLASVVSPSHVKSPDQKKKVIHF